MAGSLGVDVVGKDFGNVLGGLCDFVGIGSPIVDVVAMFFKGVFDQGSF